MKDIDKEEINIGIENIKNEIMRLRNDRKDDKELFVKLTLCIGGLSGIKMVINEEKFAEDH